MTRLILTLLLALAAVSAVAVTAGSMGRRDALGVGHSVASLRRGLHATPGPGGAGGLH
jgi:hypothetical protein